MDVELKQGFEIYFWTGDQVFNSEAVDARIQITYAPKYLALSRSHWVAHQVAWDTYWGSRYRNPNCALHERGQHAPALKPQLNQVESGV